MDSNKYQVLQQTNLGQRIAEDEQDELAQYFVQTEQWRRVFHGEVDVVYGPKGSGKSALYSLLLSSRDELASKQIAVIPAESIRGEPVFRGLVEDPPTSETEFVYLWKAYILSLVGEQLRVTGAKGERSQSLIRELTDAGLLIPDINLKTRLRAALEFVRLRLSKPALEIEAKLDPATGAPIGIAGRIILGEPTIEQRRNGVLSVDDLLSAADGALTEENAEVWIALDRLDVAFSQSHELELNALRALFRAYLDIHALNQVWLKVFLRSDLWSRITDDGFREASHITRTTTIAWSREGLLNLLVRRLLYNTAIREFYSVDAEQVLGDMSLQDEFFYRVFPAQVEIGERRPTTFDWMLTRTQDGTKATAPRELIHLASEIRSHQLKALEIGGQEPENGLLFNASVFKAALEEVSEVRLNQTIYAEFPDLKERLEDLREQKTEQSWASLSQIWRVDEEEARVLAERLVEIGFFERRGSRDDPTYWVPFLYRSALEFVQGRA